MSTRIVVIMDGFVFVCKDYRADSHAATLFAARGIRNWGTADGLGQLADGPTSETVLDEFVPIISVPMTQVVFSFEAKDTWHPSLAAQI